MVFPKKGVQVRNQPESIFSLLSLSQAGMSFIILKTRKEKKKKRHTHTQRKKTGRLLKHGQPKITF